MRERVRLKTLLCAKSLAFQLKANSLSTCKCITYSTPLLPPRATSGTDHVRIFLSSYVCFANSGLMQGNRGLLIDRYLNLSLDR